MCKLTDALAKELCTLAKAGLPDDNIARYAGIVPETLDKWKRRKMADGMTFGYRLAHAREQAHFQVAGTLFQRAMRGERDCAEFYLARRFPEAWGRQREGPVEVEVQIGDRLKTILAACGIEESPGPGTALGTDAEIASELAAVVGAPPVNGNGRRLNGGRIPVDGDGRDRP
mgnify:CR=1 FL=1